MVKQTTQEKVRDAIICAEDIAHLLRGVEHRVPPRSKVARVNVGYDLRKLIRLLDELGLAQK